ncbi:MAG: AI-2E family transporter [Phycisphaerales bacterium JB060]
MPRLSRNWSQIALITLGVVAAGMALNAAAIAILPVVAALLLCLMFWPLRQFLVRFMPAWIAAALCCVVLIVVMAGVGGWGWYAGSRAIDRFEQSRGQYVEKYESLRDTLTEWGVPQKMVPRAGAAEETVDRTAEANPDRTGPPRQADWNEAAAPGDRSTTNNGGTRIRESITRAIAGGVQTTLGVVVALVLTIFLAYLALVEGDRWAQWAHKRWQPGFYSTVSVLVATWSKQTRRHFLAKTCSGIISGVSTGLWLWIMGVPMPWVWAALTLILNYIPNIGAFISGAPPTLLAIVELGWTEGAIVAGGLWTIETLVGNLIDPKLSGDFLKLSTFVVLVSMVFWGWLWGVAGAVMSPVLTAGLWTLYEHREQLLGNGRPMMKRPPERDDG